MNRYSKALEKGGQQARSETYLLVADSIVDPETHDPLWDKSEVAEIAGDDCRFVSALLKMAYFLADIDFLRQT